MARKQVNGQLDLFAYINSIQTTEHFGDMEMVSLMPEDVPEQNKSEDLLIDSENILSETEDILSETEDTLSETEDTLPELEDVISIEPVSEKTDDIEKFDSNNEEVFESVSEESSFINPEEAISKIEDSVDEIDEITVSKEFEIEISPSAVYKKREENNSDLVMSKYFETNQKKEAFIEYRNYNRVIIGKPDEEVKEFHFETSKEAVDFYVDALYRFFDDKNLREKDV